MKTTKSRRDIDEIIRKLKVGTPGVQVNQLQVSYLEADDDGLWFIKIAGRNGNVQIESSQGDCPFLIESDLNAKRFNGNTIDEGVSKLKMKMLKTLEFSHDLLVC